MKKHLSILALLALFGVALAGCGKEPTAPVKSVGAGPSAPALPPAASMKFDLSFFDAHGAAQTCAAHPHGVDATANASNWINAVVRIVYINLTIADTFSPPVRALQAALSQKPVPVARIDWNNVSDVDRSLTFRNVDAASTDLGDQLVYQVADATVSVTFTDSASGNTADITWNQTTGTGSPRVPDYNNGQRSCWDEHQQNMVCPDGAL